MKFNLINVVKGYTTMGRGIKTLRSIGDGATLPTEKMLEEYLSDLLAVTQNYGRILMEGVSSGRLDPETVLSAIVSLGWNKREIESSYAARRGAVRAVLKKEGATKGEIEEVG